MACLDDTVVLSILGLLRGRDLAHAALASRAMYCFAYHEPLWKALAVQVVPWIALSQANRGNSCAMVWPAL